jgi:hypothetical protein
MFETKTRAGKKHHIFPTSSIGSGSSSQVGVTHDWQQDFWDFLNGLSVHIKLNLVNDTFSFFFHISCLQDLENTWKFLFGFLFGFLREPTGNLLNHTDMSRLDGHELDIFFLSGFLYKRKFIFGGGWVRTPFFGYRMGPPTGAQTQPKKTFKIWTCWVNFTSYMNDTVLWNMQPGPPQGQNQEEGDLLHLLQGQWPCQIDGYLVHWDWFNIYYDTTILYSEICN